MNVAIVGTGYVGLVTGVCLAERGNAVHCVDTNPSVVEKLNAGKVTIYEPGLDDVYLRNLKKGRISFSGDLEKAVVPAGIIFLCLPTPPGEDGSADLKYILQVADDLGKIFARNPGAGYKVVVDKSTVPVGTSEKVDAGIRKHAGTFDYDVVSNPEFLREGFAVEDFLRPERVVIGSSSERAIVALNDLYEPFLPAGSSVIVMDEKSAEVTKYAANAFLALKISYMNDLSNFCDAVGADIDRIRDGIGSDSRIGHKFLFPGLGYGGSCLPKDVKALLKTASDAGAPLSVLQAVEDINQEQRKRFFRKMVRHFGGKVEGRRFAVWGIAFKPNTDDTREAPVFHIIDELLNGEGDGGRVRPRGDGGGAGAVRGPGRLRGVVVRGAAGGRRARDRDRVERVPQARLRTDEVPDAAAGPLRRAQHLRPAEDAGARLPVSLDRPQVPRNPRNRRIRRSRRRRGGAVR